MPLPEGFPLRPPSSGRSYRIYHRFGALSASFADNAIVFSSIAGADTRIAPPVVAPGSRQDVVLGTMAVPGPATGSARHGKASPPTDNRADPVVMIYPQTIAITNEGGAPLEFSFDGDTVHGYVPAGARYEYKDRREGGIAVRGAGVTGCRIEAW